MMAGLPGTGKSTYAKSLASALHGIVFDKDSVRSALFGEAWTEYSREQDDFCVEIMLRAAQYLCQKDEPPSYVVIDGRSFSMRYQIERVAEFAAGLGYGAKIIHLVCSDGTARRRLALDHIAKNRDFALYLKVKQSFEPIEREHITINTDGGLTEAALRQCLRYLRGE